MLKTSEGCKREWKEQLWEPAVLHRAGSHACVGGRPPRRTTAAGMRQHGCVMCGGGGRRALVVGLVRAGGHGGTCSAAAGPAAGAGGRPHPAATAPAGAVRLFLSLAVPRLVLSLYMLLLALLV